MLKIALKIDGMMCGMFGEIELHQAADKPWIAVVGWKPM